MPTERMSAKEYRAQNQPEASKRRKYHNTPVTIDGHRFDSEKEAKRYFELKILERAGLIEGLELQPEFLLLDKPRRVYRADFSYYEVGPGYDETVRVVEDVKSEITKKNSTYTLKRDLFLSKYGDGVDFREIE